MRIKVGFIFFCIIVLSFLALFFHLKQQQPQDIPPVLSAPSATPFVPQPVTIDAVFAKNPQIPVADEMWTLIATGDIIPARSVNQQTISRNDFLWSFRHIAPILQSGDITLINLETPLLDPCPVTISGMVFCGDTRHIAGLKFAGVDVVNFANNHMGNYGKAGIEETKTLVEKEGMKVSGLEKEAAVTIHGLNIAFVGFDDIGPPVAPIVKADEETMKEQIKRVKASYDMVVVSMSWGVEYTDTPSGRQVRLAHMLVENGADIVIGNHPHWIQKAEVYNGKLIIYAHGNTIFDQMWSEETKIGLIGKYTFYKTTLVAAQFFPTYIQEYGQPILLEGAKKEQVLQKFEQISRALP